MLRELLKNILTVTLVLDSYTALAQADLVTRLTKISQTLRNGKLPDAALLEKAKTNPSSVNVEQLVNEWIESNEFYDSVANWHRQMFRTPYLLKSEIEFLDKAPAGLRESLAEEPIQLALFLLKNNFPYTSMVDAQFALRNSVLTKFYNGEDPTGASATDWQPVMREAYDSGILSMKSMHMRNPTTVDNRWRTHANQALVQWACITLVAAAVTNKEGEDAHGSDPGCVSCHRPLDGMGNFFQRWERGGVYNPATAIDEHGVIFDSASQILPGEGVKGLGNAIANSKRFPQCIVDKTWQFLEGRAMTDQETQQVRTNLVGKFWQSGYNLKALIKEIVLLPNF